MLPLFAGGQGVASSDAAPPPVVFPDEGNLVFDAATNEAGGYRFEIRVPAAHSELTPAGWTLSFPGHPLAETPGYPQVGGLAFRFPGRAGFIARVEWMASEFDDVTNYPVAPVPTLRRVHLDDTRFRDETIRLTNAGGYSADHFVPEQRLWVQEAQMASQRWVRLVCQPNQYQPRQRILRRHRRIEGWLFFDPVPE